MWQVERCLYQLTVGEIPRVAMSAVSFIHSLLDQNSGHENRDLNFLKSKVIILKIQILCSFIFADQLFDSKGKTNI
jgi:hypothetical protein